MIVSRYIDLRLDDDEDVVVWSEESWANALHLLLHRLSLEIRDAFPTADYAQVLWPGLTISTFETVDALEHDVLRVNATVEVRERDAP
jgi:hypothetical protein